ncbi:hypothetical protein KDX30_15550 [Pseudomonas sp. CDFA 553]|uniref:hypothetical protein n=1 Tax=Pseudomonas quasicaspiana TaxID=2829821 RepID=UPI001E4B0877|nr:hypothetical protein [Pseudomonas quasicaspiana]MCD5989316.1 hypothetical protein [Pseudomonas quasicaspiana]
MRVFYVIAKKDLEPTLPQSSEWPKLIAYSYKHNLFLLVEGKGHGLASNDMPKSKIKESKWRDLLITLDALGVIDFIDNNESYDEKHFLEKLKTLIGSPEMIEL